MAKTTKLPEWRYSTMQVDLMLWQYCEGLKDFAPHLPREKVLQFFRESVKSKIIQLETVFKITPSFSVDLEFKEKHELINKTQWTLVTFSLVKIKL